MDSSRDLLSFLSEYSARISLSNTSRFIIPYRISVYKYNLQYNPNYEADRIF